MRATPGSRARAAGGGPPPSPARAGERLCPPARTVQVTGDSDCGPTSSDPPPSLVRAWDWQCHPARTVPRNAGDPGGPALGPPVAARRPHRPGPGSDIVLPPGRCKSQVTRTAGRRRRTRRPHQPGPGTGSATPPGRCPATRAARHRVTRSRGRPRRAIAGLRLVPMGAVFGATSQPFSQRGPSPTSAGGGRRVKVTLLPTPCTR